jgi:hypothetical protein
LPLVAQESPEEERQFIHGLRARGLSRLALEYLEKLKAKHKLDPALAAVLPMEIARTRMSLAQESPLDQRPPLYAKARQELEAFVKKNPEDPQAVPANLEIARIAALQGKAQFSLAVRQSSPTARALEAQKAWDIFAAAGKQLDAAIKKLDAQIARLRGAAGEAAKAALEALERDRLQAEFDLGISLLLQAQTNFLDDTDTNAQKRGQLAEEAEKVFQNVAGNDDKNPLGYKARAWLMPCALAMDQPKKAVDLYKEITKVKLADNTRDGKFLADYFHLGLVLIPSAYPAVKKRHEQIAREGQEWLKRKDLAAFGKSPEGYGIWVQVKPGVFCFVPSAAADVKHAIQYEVARALYEEARAIKQKTSPRRGELCRQAQKLLDALEGVETDLTPKARQLGLDLFVALRGDRIDPDQLKTFKEFYYLARYESRLYYQDARAQRKVHLRRVADALTRAIDSADGKVTARDILRAKKDLTDTYLNLEDLHRAAVLGEELARSNAPVPETAQAAGFALEAYARILTADGDLAAAAQGDEVLTDDVLQRIKAGDRRRFLDLALWVEKQPAWHDEPVRQYARYQRALLALRERNFPEAVTLLEGLDTRWQGYPISQCQLVLAAVRLSKDDATRLETGEVLGFGVHWEVALSEAERNAYQKRALAALHKLPALTSRSSSSVVRLYFGAKLEECRILYKEKKYTDLETFAAQLLQEFAKFNQNLPEQVKTDLTLGLETWANYAKVGQAEVAYGQGNYDKVLEITGPTVTRIKGLVAKPVAGSVKDFLLVRDMLELAMRANVQKNKPESRTEAKQIFDLLQQVAGNEDLTGGPTGLRPTDTLVRLVVQLKGQVEDLRRQGKAARVDLNTTTANFSEFLDELTRDLDKFTAQLEKLSRQEEKQNLKQQVLGLLAGCYASLDKHKKAATLLARITPPKPKGKQKPSPDAVREYLKFQLLYVQELRKDRQFKKSLEVLDKMGLKVEAKQSLDMIILALEAEKERVHFVEDKAVTEKDFRAARIKWHKFRTNPRLQGFLGDRNFEDILSRFQASERKAMQKEKAAQPKDKHNIIDANYRDRERRTRASLVRMYKEVVRLYFESYYHHTYCIYQSGLKSADTATRQKLINVAANNIKKLETTKNPEGWELTKHLFLALLQEEQPLRAAYDELKKPRT